VKDPVTEGRWLRVLEVTGIDAVRGRPLETSDGFASITRDRGTERIPRGALSKHGCATKNPSIGRIAEVNGS
jgi:hypothetical protein